MHKTLAEPFTGAHIHPIPVIDRPDEVPAGQPEAVRTGQHGATEVLHVGCGPYHPAALPPVFRHAGFSKILRLRGLPKAFADWRLSQRRIVTFT